VEDCSLLWRLGAAIILLHGTAMCLDERQRVAREVVMRRRLRNDRHRLLVYKADARV
jgi:hypothetical protein